MKRTLRLLTAAIMMCVCISGLAACGTMQVGLDSTNGVDIYAYDGAWNVTTKLTGVADSQGRKVEYKKGLITVTVPETDVDVELDFAPFFSKNAKHKGADFYFTRSDVKVDAERSELLKGYAWVETVAGNAENRKYKQLGYENDATKTDMKKSEIQALPDRKGEIRMYILNHGTHAGRHVTYINKDVNPDTEKLNPYFDKEIKFHLSGHNKGKAELKIKVVKAAA